MCMRQLFLTCTILEGETGEIVRGGKSFSSFVLILCQVVVGNKFIRRKELSWLRPKGNIPCRFYIIHSWQEIEFID